MVFGAHFLGIFRIGFMDREMRVDAGDRGGSAFGAYLLGLAFAFGWTPCIGPILGAILSLAANEADMLRGTSLLAAYALGLTLPPGRSRLSQSQRAHGLDAAAHGANRACHGAFALDGRAFDVDRKIHRFQLVAERNLPGAANIRLNQV